MGKKKVKEAVILEDGYIIYVDEISKADNFNPTETDILFSFSTGRVRKFKGNQLITNNDYYLSIYDSKTNEFSGYFPELEFWEKETLNEKGISTIRDVGAYDLRYFNLVEGMGPVLFSHKQQIEDDTKVFTVIKYIKWETDNEGIVKASYRTAVRKFNFKNLKFQYPNPDNFNVFKNRILYKDEPLSFFDLNKDFDGFEELPYIDLPIESFFIDYFIHSPYLDRTSLITDVVHLFQQLVFDNKDFKKYLIDENLYTPFQHHFDIVSFGPKSNPNITEEQYDATYTVEYFSLLRIRLIEFKEWVKGVAFKPENLFKNFWSKPDKIDFLVRIVGLFNDLELKKLKYDTKVQLLKDMVKDNYKITGQWNPFSTSLDFSEEEVVVKIVKAINDVKANDFLLLLSKPPDFLITTKTFYQILYDEIQDTLLLNDDGKGNGGQFVKKIYFLWLQSKYNPANKNIDPDTLVKHEYTNYNASHQFQNKKANGPKSFDETAAPILIPYESEKKLLWYDDNFNFPFKESHIVAMHEMYEEIDESTLDYFFSLVSPFKKKPTKKYVPYGFYNIFTPISIVRTGKLDTIIGIPVGANVDTPCALNDKDDDEENKNLIPIFYLKYVDDLGDYSDFKETIGVVTDVVLTFAGGIGIYKNLASGGFKVLRNYLLKGIDKAAAKQILKKIAFESWELLLETASLAYSIYTGGCAIYNDSPCDPPKEGSTNYKLYKTCEAVNNWLFLLEIVTLSGDALAKKLFEKQTRKLNQNIPAINDIPNVLPDDTPNRNEVIKNLTDLKKKVKKLDKLEAAAESFIKKLDKSVSNKLDELNIDIDVRIAFFEDFENASPSSILELGENKAIAVERWADLLDKKVIDRKDTKILTNDTLYQRYSKVYKYDKLVPELNALTKANRQRFLNNFADQSDDWFKKLAEKPEAIGKWNRMTSEMKLVAKNRPDVFLYRLADLPPGTRFYKLKTNYVLQAPNRSVKVAKGDGHVTVEMPGDYYFVGKEVELDGFDLKKVIKMYKDSEIFYSKYLNNYWIKLKNQHKYKPANAAKNGYPDIPRSDFFGRGTGGPNFEGLGLYMTKNDKNIDVLGNGEYHLVEGKLKGDYTMSDISKRLDDIKGSIKVPISGDPKYDFRNFWHSIGVDYRDGELIATKLKFEIHHVDNLIFNNSTNSLEMSIQPVYKKAHSATKSHKGAHGMYSEMIKAVGD